MKFVGFPGPERALSKKNIDNMHEPFINKEITIQAPVHVVWKVLVRKQYIE